jgi:hypothetical protein
VEFQEGDLALVGDFDAFFSPFLAQVEIHFGHMGKKVPFTALSRRM